MKGRLIDQLGVGLSVLCAIHCAALPFLVGLFPFLESDDGFHLVMAIVLLGVAVVAFAHGYSKHGDLQAVSTGVLGIILLFTALFVHEQEFGEHFSSESAITLIGSILLVWAHVRNIRACRRCGCSNSSTSS